MLRTTDFLPGYTDRAVFIGQTGSGKTTLVRHLLKWRRYTVVYDAKGNIDWPEFTVYTSLDGLINAEEEKLIYKPDLADLDNFDNIEAFFEWIYFRKNTLVYVDETYTVVKRSVAPFYYKGILTRGRERNTQLWSATQRPSQIPLEIISESEHCYCFRLQLDRDRERIENTFGIDKDAIGYLPKHQFYYANTDGSYGPFQLHLKG